MDHRSSRKLECVGPVSTVVTLGLLSKTNKQALEGFEHKGGMIRLYVSKRITVTILIIDCRRQGQSQGEVITNSEKK